MLERTPFGGAERATNLTLKLLADEGFNLTVVTGIGEVKNMGKVKWVYSPLLDVPSKLHLWLNLLTPAINQLDNLIKESDIVYIPRLAYPVIPLAKKYGKKVVVHLHDYQPMAYCAAAFPSSLKNYNTDLLSDMKVSLQHELLKTGSIRRASICSLAAPLNKLCEPWLSEADELICVSRKQRDILESAMPELSAKLKVVYNLLPALPVVEKQIGDPTILYLGGDNYDKGFHVFLSASQELLKQGYDVKFLLTGHFGNAHKMVLEKLNGRFGVAYHLMGRLKYEEVLRLHSIAHALIFPSIWEEPLPYVVLEAMLAGTIPIASRVGGVPEIVQGTSAEKMLFAPSAANEIVTHMKSVLYLSKEELVSLGMRLREDISKRLDNEQIKRQLMGIFSFSTFK